MLANINHEAPDISTSTDDYATRFKGEVGQYFLKRQNDLILKALKNFPIQSVLDVGGGHAQLTDRLLNEGYLLTTQGSSESCQWRLRSWLKETGTGKITQFIQSPLDQLPVEDKAFDAVVSIRMLSHLTDWPNFIAELCRVSRHCVIIDYPTWLSFNLLSPLLFQLKKQIEKNTRHYKVFTQSEVEKAFASQGFFKADVTPQFFWPMALHRALKSASRAEKLEAPAEKLGLTQLLGSPVIACYYRKS